MTDYFEVLGLDPSRLDRRIGFLLDRAFDHDEQAKKSEGEAANLHEVCAASLRRDAAATAALLGDISKARALFTEAGRQWLSLGFYYGLFLLRLGDSPQIVTDRGSDDRAWVDRSLREEAGSKARFERAFEREARTNPRQLLSVVQADIGVSADDEMERALARNRLFSAGPLAVGGTAMPLHGYLKLLDALERGDLGRADRDRLFAQLVQREEMIAEAREDRFHWKLARRPADMIDFDLLALGLAAQSGGDAVRATILDLGEGRGAASVPLLLAQDLERGHGIEDVWSD